MSSSVQKASALSPCFGCGMRAVGGAEGCQAAFNELGARAYADLSFGRLHRLVVDTYCLQHPPYIESAKSLAAHLLGVCAALEHENNPIVVNAIHRWLNGPARVEKPAVPEFRGSVTIASVIEIADADPAVYARAVRGWARSTWAAYGALHPLAHRWIKEMMVR
jgi:hypothetical protein